MSKLSQKQKPSVSFELQNDEFAFESPSFDSSSSYPSEGTQVSPNRSRSTGKVSLNLFDLENDDFFNLPSPEVEENASDSSSLSNSTSDKTNNLLVDLWEDDPFESEKDKQRLEGFYKDSIENTHRRFNRQDDESVVRKLQVGLYESDAALLEELFQQSKRAGLPNVSRARILRVALRHFHTCWLNQDQS